LLNALRALSMGSAFMAAILSIVAATRLIIFVTPSYIFISAIYADVRIISLRAVAINATFRIG
jgi:hypothetical protein